MKVPTRTRKLCPLLLEVLVVIRIRMNENGKEEGKL